eukprot:TRINITY_DN9800_c0_g1_i1.p1 TRINITY_DN9800_c0_g1~~TRINITY_DN9800_c0_g1_i1.p1  ORF type:complete len:593 (+),score=54.28 TRINITY_DN9800_c0_g1_i1:95-1780(+)
MLASLLGNTRGQSIGPEGLTEPLLTPARRSEVLSDGQSRGSARSLSLPPRSLRRTWLPLPGWNLSGMWNLGTTARTLELRHWPRLGGGIWSTKQYLSGMWNLGTTARTLELRHWPRLGGGIWSTKQYAGGEELVGRVLKEGSQWFIVARFGSVNDCIGVINDNGGKIVWSGGTCWVRTAKTSGLVRVRSVFHTSLMCCRTLPKSFHFAILGLLLLLGVVQLEWPGLLRHGLLFCYSSVMFALHLIFQTTAIMALIAHSFVVLYFSIFNKMECCDCSQSLSIRCWLHMGAIAASLGLFFINVTIGKLILDPRVLEVYVDFCSLSVLFALLGILARSWCPRILPSCWGKIESRSSRRGENLETWGFVNKLCNSDPEAKEVAEKFKLDCDAWATMYPMKLSLQSVFVISAPQLQQRFVDGKAALLSHDPNVRQLYHGTSVGACKSICRNGFKLPPTKGMFGKGIYFADTPMKSWQYSTRTKSGFLLLSDVNLGQPKVAKQAMNHLSADHLRPRSVVDWIFGNRQFDSVVALSRGEGGAVNVPEYVVYRPSQVLPRYVLEVCESR